jgi:hypothetical protein
MVDGIALGNGNGSAPFFAVEESAGGAKKTQNSIGYMIRRKISRSER